MTQPCAAGASGKSGSEGVGAPTRSTVEQQLAARDKLIIENRAWANKIAESVARRLPTWFTADDLRAPAEIALCKVAAKYDPSRGVPFRTFAFRRVYGACFSSVRRREYIERARPSLDAGYVSGSKHYERGDTNGDGCYRRPVQAVDPGPSPERLAELSEMKRVWDLVDQLPKKHAAVVRWIYEDGLTNREVAGLLELSEPRTSQLHSEALQMLRGMLGAGQ